MRDPKIVLKHLSSLEEKESVNNIYKNLYNPEFYLLAYQKIYSKPSQMTSASDGSTIDGMSMDRINKLIEKLRNNLYQPTPLRRVNIPKKNGKTRSISIPSFEDKLVQEIIRMLLEAIYEHTFSEHSHGFRPKKSCYTTLKYIKNKFQGTKWWIKCDIRGCFDNMNHIILLNILKEHIREQKFIHLINLFLKAGYTEDWNYHKTYSGIPQGSIISPILANIYLDKFDEFMENTIKEFTKGKSRERNRNYDKISKRLWYTKQRLKSGFDVIQRYRELRQEWKEERNKNGCINHRDPNFRRLSYVRYADDFLIGVIASKKEAEEIKIKIQEFLKNKLKVDLNEEKTKIVHNSELVRFLGYDLSILKSNSKPSINGLVGLWLPYEVCKDFIIDNRFGKFVCDSKTGKPKLKAIHRPEMETLDELEILMQYNSKIRGLYNYYKMASNVYKLNNFNFILQTSFLRTLCAKYKTSRAKLYKNKNYNHQKNGAHIGVTYKDKFYEFFNGPFNVVDDKNIKYEKNIDIIENMAKYFSKNSLIKRLESQECEWCHTKEGPFEVHHVKKLKDLKGKTPWEKLMISRKRKTMVLCTSCHDKLHSGKI